MNGNRKPTDRVVFMATGTFVILASFMIGIIGVSVYPWKTIEFKKPALEVLNKKVRPGDCLKIKYEFTKYTDRQAVVTKMFINGVNYGVEANSVPRKAGTYSFIGTSTKVPPEIPPGKNIIVRSAYTYNFWGIRDITVMIDTEPFEVLPTLEAEQVKKKVESLSEELGKIQRRNNIVDKKAGDKIRKEPTP
jgi:hypothetical protein